MKNTRFFPFFYLISLLLFTNIRSYAQPELNDDGNLNLIGIDNIVNDWEGEYQEYKIPADPEFDYIRFYLRGGDGGTATVNSNSAQGGDGATIEFSIKIGDGPNEIPPGKTLRFVVGKRGQDHTVSNPLGGTAISGGGGGTGIMLSGGGGNFSIPLAIAGGGGGAKRRLSGGANGQGGRAGEDGGDGEGANGSTGGIAGFASTGDGGAGGNGGAWFNGYGEGSKGGGEGIYGTDCLGGTADNTGSNGGWGCGGGGGAFVDPSNSIHGAGAGGGYSGGGGSGCQANTCGAGGGGSYLDDTYPYDTNITAGGASSISDYGYVQYQFFCSSRFANTHTITKDASCFNTESIQLAEEDPKFWCDEVTYKRVDNNETNDTGLFEGLLPGQSYDFELLYAGEVVDTYTHIVPSDVDTEDPFINCVSIERDLNDDPNPSVTVNDLISILGDNCGIASSTIVGHGNAVSFSCDDLGTNSFTIRAVDHAGNEKTCTATVEITGGYPNFITAEPLSVNLDANGEASLSPDAWEVFSLSTGLCFGTNDVPDILANYSIPTNWQNLDCGDVGVNSVLMDEVDSNFPDLILELTVIDPIPIMASVANVTVNLDASGVGTLSFGDLNFTVSDNCYSNAEIIAAYSLLSEFTSFDCMDIGTFPVTLDNSNPNFPSVILQVTVESSELSFAPVQTDFCSNTSFDLTSLEDQITTANGTFNYSKSIERLYLPKRFDNSVDVIDLKTNSVLTSIAVSEYPYGVGVHPDAKKVYITHNFSFKVSVIDVESNTVESVIDLAGIDPDDINAGYNPQDIAFNADGSRLYVTCASGDNVIEINTATNAVLNIIPTGNSPTAITLSPDDSKIYVVNGSDNTLSVLNANTGASINTINVQDDPIDVAISADGTKVYVSNRNELNNVLKGAISIIDISSNTLVQTVFTDINVAEEMAVHPSGNLYTQHNASDGNSLLSRMEPSNGNALTYYNIESGVVNNLSGIGINEDGSRLYLVDRANDKVIVFNTLTNTELTSIPVEDVFTLHGNFYLKTTIDITEPTSYEPSEGDVIEVAFDGGAECASTTSITFDNAQSCVELAVKVLLQGPYNSGSSMMKDDLNSNNLLPTSVGGYTMLASATSNTGTEAIVDWVTIELRDASDNTSVLASRPALIQADGDVVDMDGTSAVQFTGVDASSAYVVVKHRNHLGVMTAAPVTFD